MSQKIYFIRAATMGTAGLVCALYALLALIFGRPDPMPFWIPGVLGLLAWLVISLTAWRATQQMRNAAFDEGYLNDDRRAQQLGFWVGIMMYPAFGLLLFAGWVSWPVAFAAMGTGMAATYLLATVWFDMQGRA